MIQFVVWPPPDWPEVVITWEQILADQHPNPNKLYDWCKRRDGGMFHVHGWKSTEGFAFRFEHPKDATVFALMWS